MIIWGQSCCRQEREHAQLKDRGRVCVMAWIQSFWENVVLYYWDSVIQFDARSFHWPTLIFPVALIVFVVFFFRDYGRAMKPQPGTLEWIGALERPKLSLTGRLGRMSGKDWLCALLVTVVYGVVAFSFSGDRVAPQTFWRASGEDRVVTLDLGEKVQLDTLMYYTGLGHSREEKGWVLELSADGEVWREQPLMSQKWSELFKWKYAELEEEDQQLTRYIRMTAERDGMELGELVLVIRNYAGARSWFDPAFMPEQNSRYNAMFDEQHLFPSAPNQNNGMIFDEIYHARTAYEYIRNVYPTETTHPPLGKAILSLGIKLFGMTPFGWRFMGILFGILMVPLIYVLIKELFGNTTVAFCGTAIFAFENMHYTQTHLATIDTYVVFFILCMYLFMYRYITSGYDTPFVKTLPPLFLCGLSFGLGVASKWTGAYAAFGLVVLYIVYLVRRGKHQAEAGRQKEYRAFLLKTLGVSVLFFVVIPLVVYTLSYIPYTMADGQSLTAAALIRDMWENQKSMLKYHGDSVLGAEHPYQSLWWMWMLDIRPILYYSNYADGGRTMIGAFTNPLVTIGGLAAMGVALFEFFRKKKKEALFIVVGYLAQLVPWMMVSRITFAYHYFPAMIFLTLAICYVFHNLLQRGPEYKWRVYLFTGVSVALFFLLFPPTAGLYMQNWYSTWFVKWLPGWPF